MQLNSARCWSLAFVACFLGASCQDLSAESSDLETSVGACFERYVAAVKANESTAVNFFSRRFLANNLNDLLQSDPEDFYHNRRAVQRLLFLPARIRHIDKRAIQCERNGKCQMQVNYTNTSDKKSEVILFYETAHQHECALIDKIQINIVVNSE